MSCPQLTGEELLDSELTASNHTYGLLPVSVCEGPHQPPACLQAPQDRTLAGAPGQSSLAPSSCSAHLLDSLIPVPGNTIFPVSSLCPISVSTAPRVTLLPFQDLQTSAPRRPLWAPSKPPF